jgi:hypothetical protein
MGNVIPETLWSTIPQEDCDAEELERRAALPLAEAGRWMPISEFRGEPDAEPLCWWWAPGEEVQVDRAILGTGGTIEGKHACGLLYLSHVMLMPPAHIPEAPK